MNVLYLRTFKNPLLLQEMLELRRQGWSITALAQKYDCNFTSIWHQCKKHNIGEVRVTVRLTQTPQITVLTDFNGERLNRGKTYKEYLLEEQERRRQMQMNTCRPEYTGVNGKSRVQTHQELVEG
jgi:hypothetical protein